MINKLKQLFLLFLILILPLNGFSADVKITDLPLDAAPTADDLIVIVDDPGGSPVTKKATIGSALALSLGWYDSSAWASINAAVAAIGATSTTLVVSTAETQTADIPLTFPSTLSLVILKGGSIIKNGTSTVIINGPFEAGLYQVFSGFDAGDVTFGPGAAKVVYPEWWGNNTTPGTTDMTIEWQSAIDSLVSIGGNLRGLMTTYLITTTIELGASYPYPINLHGSGNGLAGPATEFLWGGNATDPMFDLQGLGNSNFENFTIRCNIALPLLIGIKSTSTLGRVSTNNKFKNVILSGGSNLTPALGTGFAFVPGTAGDANNDLNTFTDVQVQYYTNAGWSFQHAQSRAHEFYSCDVNHGVYGLRTDEGAGSTGGSFRWYGGTAGNLTGTMFKLGATSDNVLISGLNAENCANLMITASQILSILIEGVYFNWIDKLPVDQYFLTFNGKTNVSLIGNSFYGSPGYDGLIYLHDNAEAATITAIGNIFKNESDASWYVMHAPTAPWKVISLGNQRYLESGVAQYWNDSVDQRIITLANDATPSVLGGSKFITGGTTTITDFDDGEPGQIIIIIAEHTLTIIDGTNIFLNGSANFVMAATDTLTLIQKSDGLWYELSRSDNN